MFLLDTSTDSRIGFGDSIEGSSLFLLVRSIIYMRKEYGFGLMRLEIRKILWESKGNWEFYGNCKGIIGNLRKLLWKKKMLDRTRTVI